MTPPIWAGLQISTICKRSRTLKNLRQAPDVGACLFRFEARSTSGEPDGERAMWLRCLLSGRFLLRSRLGGSRPLGGLFWCCCGRSSFLGIWSPTPSTTTARRSKASASARWSKTTAAKASWWTQFVADDLAISVRVQLFQPIDSCGSLFSGDRPIPVCIDRFQQPTGRPPTSASSARRSSALTASSRPSCPFRGGRSQFRGDDLSIGVFVELAKRNRRCRDFLS